MATITTIQATDLITNSRAVINTNFANLNSDKIETSYLDTDTTLAANSDTKIATQKAVKAYVDTGGNVNASETTKGIVEEATDAEVTAGTATGATGAKLAVTPAKLATRLTNLFRFGGTGADGALAITADTTTIDLGGASLVVKNYTSISITGTGVLAFSNPHANGTVIILKSQGDVTLTSSATPMINATNTGAASPATQTNYAGNGNDGNAGLTHFLTSNFGVHGQLVDAGAGGAKAVWTVPSSYAHEIISKYPLLFVGASGGNPGAAHTSGTNTATAGKGGGCVVIECKGAWNFTTTNGISVAGSNGSSTATGADTIGGAGGGAGGQFIAFYSTLTANTGTVTVAGGSAGSQVGGANGGGGGGGSLTAGSTAVGSVGGAGASGQSLIAANTEFV